MHTNLRLKSINPQIECDIVERALGWEAGDKDLVPPLLTLTYPVVSGKSFFDSDH